jgi:hypothetical protein
LFAFVVCVYGVYGCALVACALGSRLLGASCCAGSVVRAPKHRTCLHALLCEQECELMNGLLTTMLSTASQLDGAIKSGLKVGETLRLAHSPRTVCQHRASPTCGVYSTAFAACMCGVYVVVYVYVIRNTCTCSPSACRCR